MAVRLKLAAKKLLAIDWDSRDVRVVMFRPKADGIDLLKAVSIPIQAGVTASEPEAFGAFLRAALAQANMNVKHALLTIPRDRVVLNNLRLPPTPPDELPSMVQLQIGKELPFPADQATIDFALLGAPTDGKAGMDVLVAAVRNDYLEPYRTIAYEAGLSVDSIGLRPHGNVVAVTSGEAAPGTMLLVEVGPSLTEIDFVRDGVPAYSRAASAGVGPSPGAANGERIDDSRIFSFPIQDREPDETTTKAVGYVLREVVHTYEAYRATDPTVKINRIVVAGATGIETELAQALGGRFALRAELYSPEKALNLTAQRARELRGFSAVLGLAMSHAKRGLTHFDFQHPKKTVTKSQRQLKKAPIAAAVALLFLGTGMASYWNIVIPKQKLAKSLVDNVNVKKKQFDVLTKFNEKVLAVQSWQDDEQYWPDVLLELTKVFPPETEAYVTHLTFGTALKGRSNERLQTVAITMRTAEDTTVNRLAEKLKEKGFDDVRTGRTNENSQKGGYRYDASITATLPKRKAAPVDVEPEAVEDEAEPPAEDVKAATTAPAEPPASSQPTEVTPPAPTPTADTTSAPTESPTPVTTTPAETAKPDPNTRTESAPAESPPSDSAPEDRVKGGRP